MCSSAAAGQPACCCHQYTSVLRASEKELQQTSPAGWQHLTGKQKIIPNSLLTFTTWSSMMMGPTKVRTVPNITARTPTTINPIATLALLIAMSASFTDGWHRVSEVRGRSCKTQSAATRSDSADHWSPSASCRPSLTEPPQVKVCARTAHFFLRPPCLNLAYLCCCCPPDLIVAVSILSRHASAALRNLGNVVPAKNS